MLTVFVDFGTAFPGGDLDLTVGDYTGINGANLVGMGGDNPDAADVNDMTNATTLRFSPSAVNWDYNGSGGAPDQQDMDDFHNDVMQQVINRFSITTESVMLANIVEATDAAYLNAINTLMTGNDTYVFATDQFRTDYGAGPVELGGHAGFGGIAPGLDSSSAVGPGVNNADETVMICGGQWVVDDPASDNRLADVIVHESGHAGGLPHTFDTTGGPDNPLQSFSNVMSYSRDRAEPNVFTRYPLEVDFTNGGGVPDPTDRFTIYYEQVTAPTSFGRAFGAPEYVTGTGAHDLITISYFAPGLASVEVTAYSDAARTTALPVPHSANPVDNWFALGYFITGASDETFQYLISTVNGVDVFATQGADSIVIDAAIAAHFNVVGGLDDDVLRVRGDGSESGTYTPSPTDPSAGNITIDGGAIIDFSELEPVQIDGFMNFTFTTPNSADILTVDSPAAGRNRVTGTSDGVAFEAVTFFDVVNVTVEMGTNDGGSPNDLFTIDATGLIAAGLSTFTVNGGPGNDTFFVKPSTTSNINVNGGPPVVGDPGVPPGDMLVVDAIGVGNVSYPRNVSDGTVTSSTHRPIIFTSIETLIVSDRFEVNDTIDQATVLGSDEWITLRDLSIHSTSDVDFFRVTAHDTGKILLNTIFDHEVGNLDLEVQDSFGNIIALADSADDNEKLSIPVVRGEVYYVVVNSPEEELGNYTLEIEQFPAPIPRGAFLDPASDTGRSNADRVTNDSTPRMLIQADVLQFVDENDSEARDLDEIRLLTAAEANAGQTAGIAVQVLLTNTTTGNTLRAFADPFLISTLRLYEFAPSSALADGVYVLTAATRMFDGQQDSGGNPAPADGRSPYSEILLTFTVDTVAPVASFGQTLVANDGLAAESDSGVQGPGNADTIADRITNDTTPSFFGVADANLIVQAWLDLDNNSAIDVLTDVPIGEAVSIPLDGNVYSEGSWKLTSVVDMNDPLAVSLFDGLRRILIRIEDLAGNIAEFDPAEPTVNEDMVLEIFIDTQGPQITSIHLPDDPGTPRAEDLYDLFSPKATAGPTPSITQLVIQVQDLPNRVADDFLYDTLVANIVVNPAHFLLTGDGVGVIAIESVSYTQDPVVDGQPATGHLTLTFFEPLPDDRFTLTVSDALVDPANNGMDGESNAVQPLENPLFPSGDGQAGGSFVGRFSVDSRPEIGVTAATRIYLDINGNWVYDPAGSGDETNRDLIFQMGLVSDAYFAGNFQAVGGGLASGFDKLGTYGWDPFASVYRFLLDFNHNGVPDFMSVVTGLTTSAIPVAGNFAAGHDGDELGLFTGAVWHLDTNGDNVINVGIDTAIPTTMRGIPAVGDVNGDGSDDLITYDAGADRFYIDLNRDGVADDTIQFGIPDFVERPVVGDLNLDGVDDLGLWVAGSEQKIGEGKAEWYFLISDRVPDETSPSVPLASSMFDPYSPDPLGNDLFANYGDRYSLPILGNFDPPVAGEGAGGGRLLSYTNRQRAADVSGDGRISPLDALLVINRLNAGSPREVPDLMVEYDAPAPYWDVNDDRYVTPLDALSVINLLNQRARGEGEGEAFGVASMQTDSALDNPPSRDTLWVTTESGMIARTFRKVKDSVAEAHSDLVVPVSGVLLLTGESASRGMALLDTVGSTDETNWEEVLDLIADDVTSTFWS